MSTILPSIETLNRYSPFLQVLVGVITATVTIVYVRLTWRNLKAFERSTRNDREAEHLNAIKLQVVAPILSWIDEAQSILQGRGSHNIVGVWQLEDTIAHPKPFFISEISVLIENLSLLLLADATQNHFPNQLGEYSSAVEELEHFLKEVAAFARGCCDELETLTRLPRPKFNDRVFDCFDIELFVQGCLRSVPQGAKVRWFPQPTTDQSKVAAWFNGTQAAIAQDTEENLKEWMPESIEFVTQRWKDSNLGHRMDLPRRRFEKLTAAIVEIDLYQTLPGGCKYLGE